MRFHLRSIISCWTGFVVAISGAALAADDASTLMPEPAVVLTAASIDRGLEDVDHLLTAGGKPNGPAVVQAYLTKLNQLQGLDRSRPLGVMLFLDRTDPDREPTPLVFLPLANLEDLQRTIELTGNTLEPARREGIYSLRLGKDRLMAAVEGDLLLVMRADQASALVLNETVLKLAADGTGEFDIVARLRRNGVPPQVFDKALSELAMGIERDSQPKPEESEADRALRAAILDALAAIARLVVQETDELRLGCLLTAADGGTIQCDLETTDEGAFRPWLQQALAADGDAPLARLSDAPLSLSVSLRLTEKGAELGERIVNAARDHVRRELANAARPDESQAAEGLFDAMAATFRMRRLDAAVQFHEVTPGPFVFLAAAAVEQADAIDRALRIVLRRAAESENVEGVEFDHTLAGDVRFHQVRGTKLRERDVRLYGEAASLFVGAGAGRAWLVVGGGQTAGVLKQAVAPPEGAPSPRAAVQLSLHLRPWAALAAADPKGQRWTEVMRGAFPESAANDRLDVALTPTDRGARLTARFDEGYVQLLAKVAALRAGK